MKCYSIYLLLFSGLMSFSCSQQHPLANLDEVDHFQVPKARLGDGVPVSLSLTVRWQISKPAVFYKQFASADTFSHQIMYPRLLEEVNQTAATFMSIDSVFNGQRQAFITSVKSDLLQTLEEDGIQIKEIFVKDIGFPVSYTQAMEQAGLQEQELERIRQRNTIDIAQAKASEKKAEAQAKVQIAEARSESEIARIQAQTEKNRRQSQLAKAETEAQIDRKKAEAEAERLKLLAKAELEKQEDLKKLEIQKKREFNQLEVEKRKMMDKADFEQQIELAKVYQANPVYASFVVNKELASKVEIAVLPTGTDPNVFGSLLKQGVPQKDNNQN